MVDSNEVHHWRWIIWGVGINYQALKPKLLSFFLPIHHDESLWIHTKQLDLGKHQAKPSSSSKGMLQPSLFLVRNTNLSKKLTQLTLCKNPWMVHAGREDHGMFDSSFGDSIDLHLSWDPDRCFRLGMSGQVECCGKLCQGLEGLGLSSKWPPQTSHQVINHWDDALNSRHFFSLSRGVVCKIAKMLWRLGDFGDFLQMLLR